MSTVQAQDIATTLYPYIYTNLNNWPCVRLLNATGTIGCHSLKKKTGILYQINTQDDISDFVANRPQSDYALVLPYHLLTSANLDTLASTGKVTGLVILLTTTPAASLSSPDSSCPNCQFGLYANDTNAYQWNPQAQNLIEQTFDFPIFAIRPEDDTSQKVYDQVTSSVAVNVANQYKNYPLKAVDFDLFMWAAVNSETCLRRGWCQVVGGMSVYSTPSLAISADDNKPIVVVSASLDSRSLFHDLTVGASNDVSGMVTVLAIADALSRAPTPLDQLPKHILYTLFAAESWGFAGSQRFVKDISTPFVCTNASRATPCPYTNAPCTFPCVRNTHFQNINFNNIESIFEFQSVSGINSNYTEGYYVHVDDAKQSQPLISAVQPYSNIKMASADGVDRKLPPGSSAMSFLQKKRDIQAAVITDYQKQLGNYYNSDMDDGLDVPRATDAICGLVNATANAIYSQASNGNLTNPLSANCTLIASMLDCLISNFSCPFMQNYFNVTAVSRIPHYASVYSFENPQPQLLQRFAFSFLSGVTGKQRMADNGQPVSCQTIRDCVSGEYCIKQQCTTSLTTYHEAYGTGLQYDEATGRVHVVDPTKGTWTESTWDSPTMRIFLITSTSHQVVEFVLGLLWMLASFATVLFVKKYLKKTLKTE
ncbi:Nicastrin-domain-containing protein [Mucor lusitanicus]|uniref:Nicastrin n=1 Tax=Mucor circinelloides f. lusitanicus TaxID=29924 RepID=A0A8H4BFK9_MUCCL|nr:Nicastrin-domain-containing protein [Mucor lusitanicus]